MPLYFLRGDITKIEVDAIVNAANPSLLGGGGVDGAIHRAAGRELLEECRTLGGCAVGQAKSTKGYRLPAKYVIHTVGPVWYGGRSGEKEDLAACYRASLDEARRLNCESVAFPLISSGVYGYPKDAALAVAVETVSAFLGGSGDYDPTVYLTFYDDPSPYLTLPDRALLEELVKRPPECSAGGCAREARLLGASPAVSADRTENARRKPSPPSFFRSKRAVKEAAEEAAEEARVFAETLPEESLEERLRRADESFSSSLLRLIDEKGMTDAACYKKANVDRKLFSKIRSNPDYRPSKQTVLAFAVALNLTLPETDALLSKAGFALSRAQKGDIIVSYFIEKGDYNIFAINEALFAFDQALLGAS